MPNRAVGPIHPGLTHVWFELERPGASAETAPAGTLEASVRLPRRVSAQRRGLASPAPHAPGRVQRHYGSKAGFESRRSSCGRTRAPDRSAFAAAHERGSRSLSDARDPRMPGHATTCQMPGLASVSAKRLGPRITRATSRCRSVASRRWWLGRGALVGLAGGDWGRPCAGVAGFGCARYSSQRSSRRCTSASTRRIALARVP